MFKIDFSRIFNTFSYLICKHILCIDNIFFNETSNDDYENG
jgi:hypothetical protein